MGGPERAPQAPRRSERRGEAVALLELLGCVSGFEACPSFDPIGSVSMVFPGIVLWLPNTMK